MKGVVKVVIKHEVMLKCQGKETNPECHKKYILVPMCCKMLLCTKHGP